MAAHHWPPWLAGAVALHLSQVPGPVLYGCVLVGAVVQGPSLSLERSFVRCSVAAGSASMHSGAATRHLATSVKFSDCVTLNFGSVSTEVAEQ